MRSSISSTPTGVDEKVFPFYCSICMEYFADIMECGTCSNYCCVNCLFLLADGTVNVHEKVTLNELLLMIHKSGKEECSGKCMSCPHCMTEPFLPVKVQMKASGQAVNVRSYKDEVPEVEEKESGIACGSTGKSRHFFTDDRTESPGSLSLHPPISSEKRLAEAKDEEGAISPVRVGDDFSALKRKMRKFQAKENKPRALNLHLDTEMDSDFTDGGGITVGGSNNSRESPPREECRGGSPVGAVRSYVESAIREALVEASSPRPMPVKSYVEAAMMEALAEVAAAK